MGGLSGWMILYMIRSIWLMTLYHQLVWIIKLRSMKSTVCRNLMFDFFLNELMSIIEYNDFDKETNLLHAVVKFNQTSFYIVYLTN